MPETTYSFDVLTPSIVTVTVTPKELPPEPPSGGFTPVPGAAGAAEWVSPSALSFSSLAAGPVGQLTAWTRNSMLPAAPYEYGYAYKFGMANQWPAGLTIDPDSGLVTANAPIAAGTHSLGVAAANRGDPSLVSTFAVELQVKGGTTGVRSGDQILHKLYDPHVGTWGQPAGNDWTAVFKKINAEILQRQEESGMDGNLWVTLQLRGGVRYEYTANRWACGIQFLEVTCDPDHPGIPQLCCTARWEGGYDIEAAPIQAGGGSVFDFFSSNPASKTWTAKIDSCGVGDTWVSLKSAADASKIKAGRWHMVCSYDQQASGGPPNCRYYDWVKIVDVGGVSGTMVTLDRPLRHEHSDTYWERYPQDDFSFGEARLVPMDVGGKGGVEAAGTKSLVRATQRAVWRGVEFLINPNYPNPMSIGSFVYEDNVEAHFIGCKIPYAVPSISKHVSYRGCTIPSRMEADKLTETLVVDQCDIGGEGIGSSTGMEFWLVRDSKIARCQSSPRHMRSIRTIWDIQMQTNISPIDDMSLLISPGIPGPIHLIELEASKFSAQNGPAYNPGTVYPRRDVSVFPAVIGTDCSWSGGKLVVPLASKQFVHILGYVWEGMIVILGSSPMDPAGWGYVTSVSSSGNGKEQWIEITWVKGSKPTSGTLGFCRNHAVRVSDDCTFGNAWTRWYPEGMFFAHRVPATWGASYDFPQEYPYTGFR